MARRYLLVVILVVLTESGFRFSLLISQLLAKAIPVRGAKRHPRRDEYHKRDASRHYPACPHN
ncbi:hypothetical protein [Sodalis glossinidius]|uniref:hypothetical protein n=1 Tax=Sodalis glossinidius TaxID=63612 RepID=UPI001FB05D81|nr:hypothetical protein [Sodalis glossinidius]